MKIKNYRLFQIISILLLQLNHIHKKEKLSNVLDIKLYYITPISQMHVTLIDYLKKLETKDIVSTIIFNIFNISCLLPLFEKNANHNH